MLSETAPGAADNSSRILASLEGRVVAQQSPRRRSKKPLMIAALAVVGFGALGAWQWQRGQMGESHIVGPGASGTSVAAGGGNASAPAAVATASVAQTGATVPASAPQTAVIVADDSAHADTVAAQASSPDAGGDRLSLALASGAAPAQAPVAAATAEKAASAATVAAASAGASAPAAKRAAAKAVASRSDRPSAKGRQSEKVAAAHASKHTKSRAPAVKDDPDADLLAALVARTKPYQPNAAAPKGASAGAAAKAGRPAADAHRGSVGDQVKACDKGNFFEAQACRWRVCNDHWGKDPACPSTASAAQTH